MSQWIVRFCFALPLAVSAAPATDAPPRLEPIPEATLPVSIAPEDEAFNIRVEELERAKGATMAFAFLQSAYQRNPRPHIKALYAQYLYLGHTWGAPDGQKPRGLQLATEALKAGAVRALTVVGWALARGTLIAMDSPRAKDYATRGAVAGDPMAMTLLGDLWRERSIVQCEYWYELAAINGRPSRLYGLGKAFENGEIGGQPDWGKACHDFYFSAVHGNGARVYGHMKELEGKDIPGAKIVAPRLELRGIVTTQSRSLLRAAHYLSANCPNDPDVLTDLGFFCMDNHADLPMAKAYLERAAGLGSADARCLLARMWAEGRGFKKDPAKALAEWRKLAATANNASAWAELGYYRYWGTLANVGWGKDPGQAFYYSKRAAEAGNPFGARNLAFCYGDGIGTPKNYALAAKYSWFAVLSGAVPYEEGRALVDRYLAFVKE